MDSRPDPSELRAILASLGQELRRPLDALQGEIDRLLDDPNRAIPDAQKAHTQTMRALCEDLRRLTAECLGDPGPAGKVGPEPG